METKKEEVPAAKSAASAAQTFFQLKSKKEILEERLKLLNKGLEDAAKVFHEACLTASTDRITITGTSFPDGIARTFSPTFRDSASLVKENLKAAIRFLYKECPGIITQVFPFGKLPADAKKELMQFNKNLVAKFGEEVLQFEVNPQTLSAWTKTRKEGNLPIPPEFVSVFTRETVSVRKAETTEK